PGRPAVLRQTLDALAAWLQTAAPAVATPPAAAPADADTAATTPHLLYLPGPAHLRIAVQVDGRTTVREVDIGERALLDEVAALRQAVQDPGRDPRPLAQALYARLWAPVADLLPPDAPLQIQAEGVLRYLPFGLLHDGGGWLLERHTLAMDAGPPPARAQQ
ncbi:CHAT domain-containing protein, partial [Ideonella dechloratans]